MKFPPLPNSDEYKGTNSNSVNAVDGKISSSRDDGKLVETFNGIPSLNKMQVILNVKISLADTPANINLIKLSKQFLEAFYATL